MLERTVVLVKPDGVQRGLIGEIIKRFEQRGLRVCALKMVQPSPEIVSRHYTDKIEWLKSVGEKAKKSYEKKGVKVEKSEEDIGRDVRSKLMDYLSSAPIVAMSIEGMHAIEIVRKIVGGTEPKTSPPGTIRGDYTIDSYELADKNKRPVKNIIHASGNKEEAENEIKVWFSENEIFHYDFAHWKHMF